MDPIEPIQQMEGTGLAERVKGAVIWRSGSQIVGQIIAWAATFLVIRLLDPQHYGLFAMTQVVLAFLNLMNGSGFASALVRSESIDRQRVAQVFGMLLLLNAALAIAQLLIAPLAAAYFRQPIVAQILSVQALLYAATPFIAIPGALLSREIDFRQQAKINIVAATLSAATALTLAATGWGVWTLVAAPIVLFWARAIGLMAATRWLVWPSFRFKGAGALFSYGGAMVIVQFFWFVQSQSDVFIAGRLLHPHELGLYTTALFLTQILATKFVPPLNEVAFAAYSRIQGERERLANAFLRSAQLVMFVSLPFYFGLAATAEPLILTFLGPKWAQTASIVPTLALAMPFLTLQTLFAPATNALGVTRIAIRTGFAGAVILPAAFLIGLRFGIHGLSLAWLGGMVMLTLVTMALSLPVLSLRTADVLRVLYPGLAASSGMAAIIMAVDASLSPVPPQLRLGILVMLGMSVYGALLFCFARSTFLELLALLRPRKGAGAPLQAP